MVERTKQSRHITQRIGSQEKKLYSVRFPVAVSELHVPEHVTLTNDHQQWWSTAEIEDPEPDILEIRVWATSRKEAIKSVFTKLTGIMCMGGP